MIYRIQLEMQHLHKRLSGFINNYTVHLRPDVERGKNKSGEKMEKQHGHGNSHEGLEHFFALWQQVDEADPPATVPGPGGSVV